MYDPITENHLRYLDERINALENALKENNTTIPENDPRHPCQWCGKKQDTLIAITKGRARIGCYKGDKDWHYLVCLNCYKAYYKGKGRLRIWQ